MTTDFQNKLRYYINRFIYDNGYAPRASELSKITGVNTREVEQALQSLANEHALVLHPGTFDIWVAHPFALFPTLFWVRTGEKQWWGNCAWCSLGIASLSDSDTDIFTKLQGREEPVTIHIRNLEVKEKDYVVHMPLPAKNSWDNVINFCANTLILERKPKWTSGVKTTEERKAKFYR